VAERQYKALVPDRESIPDLWIPSDTNLADNRLDTHGHHNCSEGSQELCMPQHPLWFICNLLTSVEPAHNDPPQYTAAVRESSSSISVYLANKHLFSCSIVTHYQTQLTYKHSFAIRYTYGSCPKILYSALKSFTRNTVVRPLLLSTCAYISSAGINFKWNTPIY